MFRNVSNLTLPDIILLAVYFNRERPKALLFDLQTVQPSFIAAPATFWKALHDCVLKEFERERLLTPKRPKSLQINGKELAQHSLLYTVKKAIGCGRLRMGYSGLFPLSATIISLFGQLGIDLREVYMHPFCTGFISCGMAEDKKNGKQVHHLDLSKHLSFSPVNRKQIKRTLLQIGAGQVWWALLLVTLS